MVVAVLIGEVVRELFTGAAPARGCRSTRASCSPTTWPSLALPLVLGAAVRSSRDRERELAAQTAELQREREENARRAVLEERVRIARELHDVVAHHVSVMGVQAGAARRVMGTQPEKAEEVLSSIEASSRQAVVELHRLLGFLRRDGPGRRAGAAAGPRQLPRPRRPGGAGRAARSSSLVEGEPRPLPRTLEVSAYRVIQEALTNALKHSGGTTATVRVGYGPTALEIEVRDDGNGGARAAAERGRRPRPDRHARAGRPPRRPPARRARARAAASPCTRRFPLNGHAP